MKPSFFSILGNMEGRTYSQLYRPLKSHIRQESPILYLFPLIIIIMPTFTLRLSILPVMRDSGGKGSVFP